MTHEPHQPPQRRAQALPAGTKKDSGRGEAPRWIVEWMREQTISQAKLIEEALVKLHNLTPPK